MSSTLFLEWAHYFCASFFYAKLKAVNLAEFSMVIMIIGMIGEMTVPPMVSDFNEKSNIIALKHAYASMTSAYGLAINENSTPDTWGIGEAGDAEGLANINTVIAKYFRTIKNCGTGTGCFPETTYKNLKGMSNFTSLNEDTNYTKFLLENGTSLAITQLSDNCSSNFGSSIALQNVCGMFVFDVNGVKMPNTYGDDVFGFAFTKYGLVPLGSAMQSKYPFSGFCSMNSNANKTYENGLSCTAWAMYNENMVYKDCTGLNWKGKTQCK